MTRIRGLVIMCTVALGLAVSGCASLSVLPGQSSSGTCAGDSHQDGPAAPAAEVRVVCGWSTALRDGNISSAAGFFHLPSLFDDGGGAVAIRTRREAEVVNGSLPCGAKVISAFRQGRLIDVLFRLTARAGRGGGVAACGRRAIGTSARTAFLIHDGRILEWVRAPSRPGDPGLPGGSGSGAGSGSSGGDSTL